MVRTIFYMYKPGDERAYAMTTPPALEWAAIQKADGFIIATFEIVLPDVADLKLGARLPSKIDPEA